MFLVRWLLFRMMFASGVVKVTGNMIMTRQEDNRDIKHDSPFKNSFFSSEGEDRNGDRELPFQQMKKEEIDEEKWRTKE